MQTARNGPTTCPIFSDKSIFIFSYFEHRCLIQKTVPPPNPVSNQQHKTPSVHPNLDIHAMSPKQNARNECPTKNTFLYFTLPLFSTITCGDK